VTGGISNGGEEEVTNEVTECHAWFKLSLSLCKYSWSFHAYVRSK